MHNARRPNSRHAPLVPRPLQPALADPILDGGLRAESRRVGFRAGRPAYRFRPSVERDLFRVLFVDDEARVLEGLRRILFSRRGEWDMHFVTSGAAALQLMETLPVDVVVSDMRMPEMDGSRLLAIVRERHPSCIRIVLSGHSDEEAAVRAMTVAHTYLSKPCDADTLAGAVHRALRLRASLSDEHLRTILHQTGSLPAAPRVYLELVRTLSDSRHTQQRIADLVSQDGSLAAHVLHLANSAFFGRPGEVPHLGAALARLGEKVLRGLVLSAEAYASLANGARDAGLDLDQEQRHGAMVARLASEMAGHGKFSEDAFSAGLLHDIGKLVLGLRLPHAYRMVVEECERHARLQHLVEREFIGTDHALVGGYLLDLWGLPGRVVEAVVRHHDSDELFEGVLDSAAAVAYANRIVVVPGHRPPRPDDVPEELWDRWCEMAVTLDGEASAA